MEIITPASKYYLAVYYSNYENWGLEAFDNLSDALVAASKSTLEWKILKEVVLTDSEGGK